MFFHMADGLHENRRSFDIAVETKTDPAGIAVETKTDPAGPNEWLIRDEVVRLREWGTGIVHPLPPARDTFIIGAADGCWLRLWDPAGRVSRKHAELTYSERAVWTISDLSKNGVHLDGARVKSLPVPLVPGVQIRIGGVTLIAESPLLCALRELLARFIGWSDEHCETVDQALYSVRVAATHREPLLLCGPGNLVSIARLLHRHTFGDQPFVVCSHEGPMRAGWTRSPRRQAGRYVSGGTGSLRTSMRSSRRYVDRHRACRSLSVRTPFPEETTLLRKS